MYDYKNSEEAALIRKACRGDTKAFSELYARIYRELYRFALFMMKHPQDAEDAVSETVMAAWENIRKVRKEESFRSWIFTILANKCRRKLMTATYTEELPEGTAAFAADHEEAQDVKDALLALGDEDRYIVSCSVLGGYSSEEIGQMTGLNPATVRSRKARALEKMRHILA